jgi:hypothetical protein
MCIRDSPQYQATLEELRRHCQNWIQRLVEDRKKFTVKTSAMAF